MDYALSALGAARKVYGPIDYRKAASTIQKAFRKYKKRKAVPRKSVTKRTKTAAFPAYRIGPKLSRFGRKGKKVKPLKGTARTIEKTFVSDQPHTNYVGFRQFGSGTDILKTYCMNLVKDIFKMSGAPIDSWQGAVKAHSYTGENNGKLKKIHFYFQKDTYDGSSRTSQTIEVPQIHSDQSAFSAEDYAGLIRTMLIGKWNDGYLPSAFALVEKQGDLSQERIFYSHESWGEDIVEFSASTYVNVQNVTPADGPGDGTNINDINANPLVGKIYDFKHSYVKFREEYAREVKRIPGWDPLPMQESHTGADMIDTKYLRKSLTPDGTVRGDLLTAFLKPPRGAAVFDNIDGVKSVSLPPGGYQYMKRSITIKANTRRFLYACFGEVLPAADSTKSVKPPIINKAILVAFEPAVRSTTNESTKVIFNRKIHHRLSVKKKRPSNVPRHNEVADVNTTFY